DASSDDATANDPEELRRASAFASAEHKLLAVFDDRAQRGGDVYSVPSTSPIENALHGYVEKAYADDKDMQKGYVYKTHSGTFQSDTREVGTVSGTRAWSVISGDMANDSMSKTAQAKAKAAFDDLVGAGAVFGYDGGQESGCAAPTDFLLVIDPKGKKVYTI